MEDSEIVFSEYGDGDYGGWYGVLRVDFLAIRKEVQHHGIGTVALTHILKESIALREKWPIRLVLIDALCDKIHWYEKNGFKFVRASKPDRDYGTVEMYFELMTDAEQAAVENYCEKYME